MLVHRQAGVHAIVLRITDYQSTVAGYPEYVVYGCRLYYCTGPAVQPRHAQGDDVLHPETFQHNLIRSLSSQHLTGLPMP